MELPGQLVNSPCQVVDCGSRQAQTDGDPTAIDAGRAKRPYYFLKRRLPLQRFSRGEDRPTLIVAGRVEIISGTGRGRLDGHDPSADTGDRANGRSVLCELRELWPPPGGASGPMGENRKAPRLLRVEAKALIVQPIRRLRSGRLSQLRQHRSWPCEPIFNGVRVTGRPPVILSYPQCSFQG